MTGKAGRALICCLVRERDDTTAAPAPETLLGIARACSPRVESHGDRAVVFDAAGLTRAIGTPDVIATEVRALADDARVPMRVALAPTRMAAWLLAHARPGATIAATSGAAKTAIAALPVAALADLPGSAVERRGDADVVATLRRWGLRTLGQVAALPRADVRTRLGAAGVRCHEAACGEDARPLAPAGETAPFLERLVLEWPIEGLQPLAFVLGRLCDALARALEAADRGAVTVRTTLRLVTRESHARALHLPSPIREARVLRTLILLDLESHPPPAGIDEVTVDVDVAPAAIVQGSLLDRAVPRPEDLATLVARLTALAGERRVGAPHLPDLHDPRRAALRPFTVGAAFRSAASTADVTAPAAGAASSAAVARDAAPRYVLRRFRPPVAARVDLERGHPARVMPASPALASGVVLHRAGPWRSSGRWWTDDRTRWDRDEWDVELAGGACYRLARDRLTGRWEVDAELD